MDTALSRKRTPIKARRQIDAQQSVDEHQRLKKSKVNADLMDAAVAELKAGKGVRWKPFEK